MTDHEKPSLYEAYRATAEGSQELAAANAAGQALGIIEQALHVCGVSQKDLAQELGLSEGRVSQVLNGDGNLRVGVLAKYLNSVGYELKLSAEPLKEGNPSLPLPKRGRRPAVLGSEQPQPEEVAESPCSNWPGVTAGWPPLPSARYWDVGLPIHIGFAFSAHSVTDVLPGVSREIWADHRVMCFGVRTHAEQESKQELADVSDVLFARP